MVLLVTRDDCIFRTNTFFPSSLTKPSLTRPSSSSHLKTHELPSGLLSLLTLSLSPFFTFLSLHPPSQFPSFQLSTQLTNIPSLSSFQSLFLLSLSRKREIINAARRGKKKKKKVRKAGKEGIRRIRRKRTREKKILSLSLSNDLAIKQR